jgi:inner membrane protein
VASFGHIAVGLAAGRAYVGPGAKAGKAMLAFSIISILPDADVIAFACGIPYGNPYGHRGATHSLTVAIAEGLLAYLVAKWLKLPPLKTAIYVAVVAASHGLLDTLTRGGGLGAELLWPFSTERFWAPIRFIPIAPIGLAMFSAYGLLVVLAEVVIFSPFWLYAVLRPGRKAKVEVSGSRDGAGGSAP